MAQIKVVIVDGFVIKNRTFNLIFQKKLLECVGVKRTCKIESLRIHVDGNNTNFHAVSLYIWMIQLFSQSMFQYSIFGNGAQPAGEFAERSTVEMSMWLW